MIERIKQKENRNKDGEEEPRMETLITTLSSHKDKAREGARHALVAMGKVAVPSLIEALKNKNTLMKWEAAKALSEIGEPETAPVLVEALEDDDFDVRWLAAEGLIKMNIRGLKPLLEALEQRADSVWLLEGAHHVFHDLAKGGLRKALTPILAALEVLDPSYGGSSRDRHESALELPFAAHRALETLENLRKP